MPSDQGSPSTSRRTALTTLFGVVLGSIVSSPGPLSGSSRSRELGDFGDHKSVGRGIYELRIVFDSGYRVYCGHDGDNFILLVGGTKKRQARDIAAARTHRSASKPGTRDANKKA